MCLMVIRYKWELNGNFVINSVDINKMLNFRIDKSLMSYVFVVVFLDTLYFLILLVFIITFFSRAAEEEDAEMDD